jgi:hypothetical protein
VRPILLAGKARVELAAYVAADKPKVFTQPLFYTHHNDGFAAHIDAQRECDVPRRWQKWCNVAQ